MSPVMATTSGIPAATSEPNASSSTARVAICSAKCTNALPRVASGRMIRGNVTFETRYELPVTDCAAVVSVVLSMLQTMRPLITHTAKLRKPAPRMLNTMV